MNEILRKINSLTKYPSIPTYHKLGEKGILTDELNVQFDPDELLIITEKVDGTNSRIIIRPNGHRQWFGRENYWDTNGKYLIGSREELLHCQFDVIYNAQMGIVDAIDPLADRLAGWCGLTDTPRLYVFYGETYGHKIGRGAKQYTNKKQIGFRLFDYFEIDIVGERLTWELDAISRWRDAGGQLFTNEKTLQALTEIYPFELTPRIMLGHALTGNELPTDHDAILGWLKMVVPKTRCGLDGEGKAEGVVIRNEDRSKIVKLRFEDYERTLRKKS